MMNIITIKYDIPKNIFERFKNIFIKESPKKNIIKEDDITVYHVSYTQKNKKNCWKKLLKLIDYKDVPTLYSSKLQVPKRLKLNRFSSNLFMKRLCENGMLVSVKKADINPQDINISLYDPEALHTDIVEFLIRFSSNLKIVTNRVKIYTDEANRLMNEYGVSIFVSNKTDWILPCHILLAPDKIKVNLKSSDNTIIFTASKPEVLLKGKIYYGYKVLPPEKYEKFMVEDLSVEYILSGLYESCKAYDLGALVPNYFISDTEIISFEEIVKRIMLTVNTD